MKKCQITIDTGTTNTRIQVWDPQEKILYGGKFPVGVRLTAVSGDKKELVEGLRQALELALEKAGIKWEQVEGVTASGMITSALGIREVPHLRVPAGVSELAAGAVTLDGSGICPAPLTLIPGVCTFSEKPDEGGTYNEDMMRGEETETAAILDRPDVTGKTVIFLPGSHHKVVFTDERRRITGLLTSISGELLGAVTMNTILADSVDRRFLEREEVCREWIGRGYRAAADGGFGHACFLARILHTRKKADAGQARNFLLGAVLENDLRMLGSDPRWTGEADRQIIINGSMPVSLGLEYLLTEEYPDRRIKRIEESPELPYAALGARLIERQRRSLQSPCP